MRRFTTALTAGTLAATLAFTGTAFGQFTSTANNPGSVVPVQPIFGANANIEAVGDGLNGGTARVVVQLTGVSASTPVVDGVFQIQFYAQDGNTLGSPQNVLAANVVEVTGPAGATIGNGNVDNNEVFQLDLVPTVMLAAPGTAYSFDVLFFDDLGNAGANIDGLTVDQDGFPDAAVTTDTDTIDKLFEINKTRPTLSGAFVNDFDNDALFDELLLQLSFSDKLGPNDDEDVSLNIGDQTTVIGGFTVGNPNNTNTGAVTNADLNFQAVGSTTFAQFGNATDGKSDIDVTVTQDTINSGDEVITGIGLKEGVPGTPDTNLAVGVVIQGREGAFADTATPITDATGNLVDGPATIAILPDFRVAKAEWLDKVPTGVNVAGVLKVTFTLDVSSVGNEAFYEAILGAAGTTGFALGNKGTFELNAPAFDPTDTKAVLIDVFSMSSDLGVECDGLNDDSDLGNDINSDGNKDDNGIPFRVTTVRQASSNLEPDSVFKDGFAGGDATAVDDELIVDLIPLELVDANKVAFVDSDSDGTQDGVKLVFCEPIVGTSGGNSFLGIVIKRNDAITVHPFVNIDPVTGVRGTRVTKLDPVAVNNEVKIEIGTVESTDVDGGGISARETDNTLVLNYTPGDNDFDGDGKTLNGATPDTDGEATGTTDDDDMVNIEITFATATQITDISGNALAKDIGPISTGIDCAPPFLLPQIGFFTGDNSGLAGTDCAGFVSTLIETDAEPGDQNDNNSIVGIFTELITVPAFDETKVRHGIIVFGPNSTATPGGAESNTLTITDDDATGVAPGDQIAILADSGIQDEAGAVDNAYPGTGNQVTDVADNTGPYIPLQTDVNGIDIHSAFKIEDPLNPSFASEIQLFTQVDVDPATLPVGNTKFSVEGVADNSDLTTSAVGNKITIRLPDSIVPLAGTTTVTYLGSTDGPSISPVVNLTLATASGKPASLCDIDVKAREIPQPLIDGEFTAVRSITGTITTDGTVPVGIGTKVFALIAAPVAKSVTVDMGGIEAVISDDSSMEAITNKFFGISRFIYLYNDGGDMFIRDFKDADQFNEVETDFNNNSVSNAPTNRKREILEINLLVKKGISAVTLSATGSRQDIGSVDNSKVSAKGSVKFSWGILGSSDGSAASLLTSGVGDEPILSRAVIDDESGQYKLHVTAPIAKFRNPDSRLDATNWPIIIIPELPEGDRFVASGLLKSLLGPAITFESLQDSDDPSDTDYDINLSEIGLEIVHSGWNLLKFARACGFAVSSKDIPDLPNDVLLDNVQIGTELPLATAGSLFSFFDDGNADGRWTAADDGASNSFDSLIIDINCLTHFIFTLTSEGVQVSSSNGANGVRSVVGGYGVGFFNGEGRIGVFQLGTELPSTTSIFNNGAFPNNNSTLGWYIGSNRQLVDAATFRSNNGADFVIRFRRTSNGNVEIATNPNTVDPLENVDCEALFVHVQ